MSDARATVSLATQCSTRRENASSGVVAPTSGARIGRYLVMDEIGRGGMGVVIRAYDPWLQREVALKMMRVASLTPSLLARMQREAVAMAKLSHPNVVGVYDAELIGINVIIAMEYVAGATLRQWLEDEREQAPSREQILQAFLAAGRGLAAAHAVGISHRDFKPANVLVGDDGRVRVTDFGLARWQHDLDLTVAEVERLPTTPAASDLTATGDVLGTPRYMAPEQHAGATVGPAADQYAFCLALFESLTGVRAFPVPKEELEAAKRAGAPRWPSTSSRHAVAGALVCAITRGLAPDPSERWPSMDALLDALSAGMRTRPLMVASGVVLGLASTMAIPLFALGQWYEQRAQRCTGATAQIDAAWSAQRRREVEQAMLRTGMPYAAEVASQVGDRLDAYAAKWASIHREACEATTIRAEQPPEVLDLRMACLHGAKASLGAVSDLMRHADAQTVEHAHDVVAGLPELGHCSDVAALQAGAAPPIAHERAAVEAARARLADAKARLDAGKYEDALTVLEEVAVRVETLEDRPIRIDLWTLTGIVQRKLGRAEQARAHYERVLVEALRLRQRERAQDAATKLVSTLGWELGRVEEARAHLLVARALLQRGGSEEVELLNATATLHEREGQFTQAEADYRAALALLDDIEGAQRQRLDTRSELAGTLLSMRKFEAAARERRLVLEASTRLLGREHPDTIMELANLANTMRAIDESQAESMMLEALELAEKALGPNHPQVARCLANLGLIMLSRKQYAKARDLMQRAIAILEKLSTPTEAAQARKLLAWAWLVDARYPQAEAEYRRVLQTQLELYGPNNPSIAITRKELAEVLYQQRRYAEVREQLELAFAIRLQAYGPSSPHVATIHADLARVLTDLGRYGEAERHLSVAEAIFEQHLPSEHPHRVEVQRRRQTLTKVRRAH